MSVAIYLVLKEDLPAARAIVLDGKMLARAADSLTALAARLGVRPLEDFFGADPGAVAGLLDLDPDAAGDLPAERWFSPSAGLVTVRALLEALGAGATPVENAAVDDLLAMERILRLAEQAGTEFHVAVDL